MEKGHAAKETNRKTHTTFNCCATSDPKLLLLLFLLAKRNENSYLFTCTTVISESQKYIYIYNAGLKLILPCLHVTFCQSWGIFLKPFTGRDVFFPCHFPILFIFLSQRRDGYLVGKIIYIYLPCLPELSSSVNIYLFSNSVGSGLSNDCRMRAKAKSRFQRKKEPTYGALAALQQILLPLHMILIIGNLLQQWHPESIRTNSCTWQLGHNHYYIRECFNF